MQVLLILGLFEQTKEVPLANRNKCTRSCIDLPTTANTRRFSLRADSPDKSNLTLGLDSNIAHICEDGINLTTRLNISISS